MIYKQQQKHTLSQKSNILKPLIDRQWIEEKCRIFYKTLCQATIITQQTLRFLILIGVYTNPLRYILQENPIEGNIWTIFSSKL
ncbi:hypothetical protein [Bartonella sp. CM100XJJH]|uniref:hypothetical protein n=1 Tax=Bartonella sp. CM100XJJH TaxID=3243543 RepID=UPI0035CEA7CD